MIKILLGRATYFYLLAQRLLSFSIKTGILKTHADSEMQETVNPGSLIPIVHIY